MRFLRHIANIESFLTIEVIMKSSKLSSRFQITVPKEIRDALNLKAGDPLFIRALESGYIIINKAQPIDKEYYQSANLLLAEWNSSEDDVAFSHLQDI